MEQDPGIYEFGDFQFVPSEARLLRDGNPIPLPQKALEMLLILVRGNGHLIEKSALIGEIWGGAFVEEGNITDVIWMLRKALGDDRNKPQYIETVPKKGYRFVAQVRQKAAKSSSSARTDTKTRPEMTPAAGFWHDAAELFARRISVLAAIGIGVFLLTCLTTVGLVAKYRSPTSVPGLQPLLDRQGQQARRKDQESQDVETHEIYLQGRYYASRGTQEGLHRSIEYFQHAVLKDPRYAEAYSGLADSYSSLVPQEVEAVQEEYSLAKTAALRAVQLNGSLPESHTSLGMIYFRYEWDCSKANVEFLRAIELDPNFGPAHIDYANCLASVGRFDDGLEQARHVEESDPLSVDANIEIGRIYYFSRQYEKSISILRHAIDLDPHSARAHITLGMVYASEQDYPDALRESQEADQLSPADPRWDGFSGYIQARSGKSGLAMKRQSEILQRSRGEYAPAFSIALIYIGLGEHDQALRWLERAYEEHSPSLAYALVDPSLDSERSNQRFTALLEKMGLEERATALKDESKTIFSQGSALAR